MMEHIVPIRPWNIRQGGRRLLKQLGLLEAAKSIWVHAIPERQLFSQFIKRGSLVFDVGANIGHYTWKYEKLGAHVVAIEPQTENFQKLVEEFGHNKNVMLVNQGLDEKPGTRELIVGATDSVFSTMSPEFMRAVIQSGHASTARWGQSRHVPVTTLDLLIEEFGLPDFIKIDVEGFEYQVLKGLTRPIQTLSFEFRSEYIQSTLNCIAHLSHLGNYEFNYTPKFSYKLALPMWLDSKNIAERLGQASRQPHSRLAGDIYVRFVN